MSGKDKVIGLQVAECPLCGDFKQGVFYIVESVLMPSAGQVPR